MGKDVAYRKADIKKYEELNEKVGENLFEMNVLDVTYETPYKENIAIPCHLFTKILVEKRPDLLKYLPFKIVVKELVRGDNPWLKKTKKLGLYNEVKGVLTLHLDLECDHKVVAFLWLLLHEFRHHVQFRDPNITSCLANKNREAWINQYPYTRTSVEHVFHEVDPLEVEANTFACEMLGIPYPNSKFSITEDTLKRLVLKEEICECFRCGLRVPMVMTIDNWSILDGEQYCRKCQKDLGIGWYEPKKKKNKKNA